MAINEINRRALSRVVAVINGKGGVGKTTLTANIGGLLAASGWRVLLVDMDPQGNLGLDLGYGDSESDDEGEGLAIALQFGRPLSPIRAVRENLDVVPGGDFLQDTEKLLNDNGSSARGDTRLALARSLAPIGDEYDIVLIDCPPLSPGLQRAAAGAASQLLIPTKTDGGSLAGLRITAGIIGSVGDINPTIQLLGVVLFASGVSSKNVRKRFGAQVAEVLGVPIDNTLLFKSFLRAADSAAYWTRDKGLLAHELEVQVNHGPKWYEQLRSGKPQESSGPKSAKTIADDTQAIVTEFIERFTALSAPEAAGE